MPNKSKPIYTKFNKSEKSLNQNSFNSKNTLKLVSLNFRSLKNKLKLFSAYLDTYETDIFMGCETFLNDSLTNFMIRSNHFIFRNDRESRHGWYYCWY